ncbi:hypothetical protein AMTR_s00025p00080540 [Amborella trichopoda]|uniref:Uncharacterized protein n=1 Tax=Amborella trichopoda TaxID=13333 RepID=W1PWZ7_AMBTC|nr:hypothetical protein AMTR_s00025p00080540 [Amborella trichopoda]
MRNTTLRVATGRPRPDLSPYKKKKKQGKQKSATPGLMEAALARSPALRPYNSLRPTHLGPAKRPAHCDGPIFNINDQAALSFPLPSEGIFDNGPTLKK